MSDQPPADATPSIPDGPPYPVDLIADLHAGVLADDVAAALWPRVRADPESARVVAALDATRSDLGAADLVPEAPPPAVTDAIETTLAAIRADTVATAPVDASVGTVESIDDARDRLRDANRRRGMVIATVAAGIIAVVTLVVAVLTATSSSQGSVERADDTGPPSTTSTRPADVQVGALLSYLGRSEARFTGQNSPQRLERCLSANAVAPSVQVVGSGPLTVDGRAALVVLLSTGVAGRFDALVVGPDCDAGTPATISRRTLGAPQPTR